MLRNANNIEEFESTYKSERNPAIGKLDMYKKRWAAKTLFQQLKLSGLEDRFFLSSPERFNACRTALL